MSDADRRCSACGALASPDAEWCGQCFRPLRAVPAPGSGHETSPTPGGATGDVGGAATGAATGAVPGAATGSGPSFTATEWTCPTCQHRNALSAAACEVCDTPFGRLFAEPERAVEIAPERALGWSLLLPGLGHFLAGHRPEGVTRMILFAWTFGTVILMLAARSGAGGLGPTAALFWLFLLASVLLYVTSAADAWRIASGQDPLVRSRTLLWVVVGLVVVSALLAALLAAGVSRGG